MLWPRMCAVSGADVARRSRRVAVQHARGGVIAQDQPRRFGPLLVVERVLAGGDLAPAGDAVRQRLPPGRCARSVVRPKLVSKKCTSGMRICRSVMRSIFIPMAPAGRSLLLRCRSKPITASPRSKASLKLARWPLLNLARARRVARANGGDVGRDTRCALRRRCAATARPASIACTRGWTIHHSAMQRSVGSPPCSGLVVVPYWFSNVAPHDGAQPLHVEEGVLDFQRIEGPLDQLDAARQRLFALRSFSRRPMPRVAILRQDAQHVAVQVSAGRPA